MPLQIDSVEGQPVGELETEHDHARDPEENDVDAGFQDVGGVEPLEVGRLVRPAERGKRPEPRAEPGIEHVRILSSDRQHRTQGEQQSGSVRATSVSPQALQYHTGMRCPSQS